MILCGLALAVAYGCSDAPTTTLESRHRYAVLRSDAGQAGDGQVEPGGEEVTVDTTTTTGDDAVVVVVEEDAGVDAPMAETEAPETTLVDSSPVPDSDRPPEETTTPADSGATDPPDVVDAACPADMKRVGDACIDRWEAPNVEGERPLVMYHFYEAAAWCEARDKRLCYDDEWLAACAGDEGYAYPYGDVREPGRCNDDKIWRVYSQTLLNGWPNGAASPEITTLAALMDAVRARGVNAAAAADHVMTLYQGTAGGERPGCVGEAGVEDLVGNVEEWVRRRDGGSGPDFSGALVGRYWAESRTCQSRVTVHGNAFRFYEIGFRCCRDASGEQ